MASQETEPRYRSKYPRPKRDDGRVQFLTFLPPNLVQRLKGVGIERNEHAYQIVERVLTNALDRLEGRPPSKLDWPVSPSEDRDGPVAPVDRVPFEDEA